MRKIEVVDYSEEWAQMYAREKTILKDILGDQMLTCFHIGSTSVPGLKAKPIIDLLLVVKNIELLDSFDRNFDFINYEPMGEYGIPKRRFFKKGKEQPTYHIHAFQYDNINEIERHLLYRDYLRNHLNACLQYGELKMQLALKYPNDIQRYVAGKDELIKRIESEAFLWHWQKRK